ncbi:MAG: hypothetical protein ACLPKE_29270 [Streptosporangiaceae bacterium]
MISTAQLITRQLRTKAERSAASPPAPRPAPARRRAGARLRAAGAVLAAGTGLVACGSSVSRPAAPAPSAPAPVALSAMSSAPIAGATWATVPMGAVAGPNEFWQLFRLPAGGSRWALETPPDIATNGAILLAGQSGPGGGEAAANAGDGAGAATLTAGVRPSLDLSFSPITTTADGGHSWATLPPESGLASQADALAAAPDGHLIALSQDHTADVFSGGNGSWTTLTSEHSLAAAPAARSCALTGLTAAAYTPSGTPLLAGTCGRPGTAGIFRDAGGAWHQAGPAWPAALAGRTVQVVRLTRIGTQDVALLEAGGPPGASLLAAWTSDGGQHWALSPVLRLGGSYAVSASFGSGGEVAVVLAGHRGATLAGPGSPWRQLPALPAGHAVTLALPAAGTIDALAADGGTLTAWQLRGGSGTWSKTQTITVPIQYGSSSGS